MVAGAGDIEDGEEGGRLPGRSEEARQPAAFQRRDLCGDGIVGGIFCSRV